MSATLADQIFGPVAAGRECGDCVVCCRLLRIDVPGLVKSPNVLCGHNTGTGCGIHAARPDVCRGWFCAWRRIPSMPDETQPDLLGIMFYIERPRDPPNLLRKLYIRARAVNGWGDFETPQARDALDMFRQGLTAIWLEHDGVVRLAHPSDAIGHVLINGRAPETEDVAREAEAWRERYANLH